LFYFCFSFIVGHSVFPQCCQQCLGSWFYRLIILWSYTSIVYRDLSFLQWLRENSGSDVLFFFKLKWAFMFCLWFFFCFNLFFIIVVTFTEVLTIYQIHNNYLSLIDNLDISLLSLFFSSKWLRIFLLERSSLFDGPARMGIIYLLSLA
jgi:hypothetical protein